MYHRNFIPLFVILSILLLMVFAVASYQTQGNTNAAAPSEQLPEEEAEDDG